MKVEESQKQLAFSVDGFAETTTEVLKKNNLEAGHLVEAYALTGTTWSFIRDSFPERIPQVVSNGVIFARMAGEQKQQLVQELQKLDFYTGKKVLRLAPDAKVYLIASAMCGDGANDCGALKAANVGISLSETEASVASPFTSRNPNISCVPEIMREGRAALVTSTGIFKVMVCYSLAEFSSALILYSIDSNLTSFQYLFIDVCLILHLTSVFGKTQAYKGPIVEKRPSTSLLSKLQLSSITIHMFFVILFQALCYHLVRAYEWYTPFVFQPGTTNYSCFENYSVFSISLFQYLAMTLTFSKGRPYRQPFYTNRVFTGCFLLMAGVCAYITISPPTWAVSLLELQMPPESEIGTIILLIAALHLSCCLVVEDLIIELLLHRNPFHNLAKSRKKGRKEDGGGTAVISRGKDNAAFDSEITVF